MIPYALKTQFRYCLLPFVLGLILFVQAGSANLEMDTSVSPQNLWPGNSVTVTSHVYDGDNSGIPISNGFVHVMVIRVPGVQVHDVSTPTNASGWATFTFTPSETGRYSITPDASANYNNLPGLPAIGIQHKYGPSQWINVSSWHFPVSPHITLVLATTTTATPATTTSVPAVATTTTPELTTPISGATPVTQVTPAPQIAFPVPASQSDTTPPVTTLTFAGTQDHSGRYHYGVICTLAATDNAGGSGVRVTQYSFDGISWNTYSQPFPLAGTGPTVLYYRSSDNAGNTEGANVKAFEISGTGTAPEATATTLQYGTPSVATASSDIDPFHPMPLWLIALIIFIFIAAIGGGLYLKSRLDAEQKK